MQFGSSQLGYQSQGTTTFSVRLGHLGGEEAAKWGEYTDIAKRNTVDAMGVSSWHAVKSFRVNPRDEVRRDLANRTLTSMLEITLSHERLCPSYSVPSRAGGLPTVFMPWYEKGNLLDHSPTNKDSVAREMVAGLDHIHSMGLVHGNVNPSNIMISDDESACIADIGLNALLRKVIHEDRVTIPQSWMYKAPEEILPGDDEFEPTMAMDVYALAGTIYTAYTSKPPYSGVKYAKGMMHILQGGPPAGSIQQPAEIPDALWEILLWCWTYDPAGRPTMSQLVAEFERLPVVPPYTIFS